MHVAITLLMHHYLIHGIANIMLKKVTLDFNTENFQHGLMLYFRSAKIKGKVNYKYQLFLLKKSNNQLN